MNDRDRLGDGAQSPPAGSSGIDWSIFRDGEEDTFTWLWRTAPGAQAADLAASLAVPHAFNAAQAAAAAGLDEITASVADVGLLSSAMPAPPPAVPQRLRSSSSLMPMSDTADADSDFMQSSGSDEIMTPQNEASAGARMSWRGQVAAPQTVTAAPGGAAGKRQLKRRKGQENVEVRKQLRREKNLASVREFRKRKMKQLEENEARLRRLEAENMDLKMRLKIGKDALAGEQREKQQIKDQMREMLQRGASEQEVAQFLNMYKVTYSDYGPKRREKLQFHLARIRELLLPTGVTKLSLYSVEQGQEMMARDKGSTDDSAAFAEAGMAPMSLWGILAKELNVSEAQQRQILERREAIQKVRNDLNHTLGIVKRLEDVTDEKNMALEAQIATLQQILTPSQATKFIIWVKENPAFMYMLDKLVDSTLMGLQDEDA
ncbi:hypothetical protein P43SY_005865 [Pythium insidiosum]|uniref:BZIP domain-containing protein n=1 Tax=Pythium insidiosum TaxID=114742 RepID=A0AAD5M9Z9_PYTIN|nr:hypothetical protein P43SY_005865 [Pythium insidiosum]